MVYFLIIFVCILISDQIKIIIRRIRIIILITRFFSTQLRHPRSPCINNKHPNIYNAILRFFYHHHKDEALIAGFRLYFIFETHFSIISCPRVAQQLIILITIIKIITELRKGQFEYILPKESRY